MMKEDEFYDILLREKEKGEINVALESMDIIPNYKLRDSPDFVLKIKLKLSLLSQTFEVEIPIPIEIEKVGVNGALIDLQKFIEREKFDLILPMFIVSEKRILTQEKEEKMKTIFKLKEIPSWMVK